MRAECQEDGEILKMRRSIVNHLKNKHNVPCEYRPEYWYRSRQLWCCGRTFRTLDGFLNHVSEVHGVQIIYEKGIARKKVFLNGLIR